MDNTESLHASGENYDFQFNCLSVVNSPQNCLTDFLYMHVSGKSHDFTFNCLW